jgi:hypothetical protein
VKKAISFAALLLAAAAIPSTARAEEFALRIGVEAPVYTTQRYAGKTYSYNIGDTLQPAINAIITYKPDPIVGFELEFREGFAHTGGSGYSRTGTAIGPGLRFSAPLLPLYARVSLPIHVEPSPVVVGLRGAAGLEFGVAIVNLYLEGAVDTSLVGGAIGAGPLATATGPNVGPFDLTTVSLGTGLRFAF